MPDHSGEGVTRTPLADLLTVTQAAARLGLTPQAVRAYIGRGRITAVKPGHDWLIEAREVERFAAIPRKRRGPGRPRREKGER